MPIFRHLHYSDCEIPISAGKIISIKKPRDVHVHLIKNKARKEKGPKYEKPLFEETEGMTFTAEIWNKYSNGRFGCLQCSSCHGCA